MSGPFPPARSGGPLPVPRPGELADRFLARLIDVLLLFLVNCLLSALVVSASLASGAATRGYFAFGPSSGASAALTLIGGLITLGYFVLLESRRGQTVGKQVMKLRVTGPGGGNPTVEEAFRRNIWLAAFVLEFLPVLGGLAYWAVTLTAVILIAVGINNDTVSRRAWHDRFAGGTQVWKIG